MEESMHYESASRPEDFGDLSTAEGKQLFWVYLLSCRDHSLYCGSTTDLSRRIDEHNSKRGAKYTATRLPVVLAQAWVVFSWSDALRLEAVVKKCPRPKKEKLVHDPAGIVKVAEHYGLDFLIKCCVL